MMSSWYATMFAQMRDIAGSYNGPLLLSSIFIQWSNEKHQNINIELTEDRPKWLVVLGQFQLACRSKCLILIIWIIKGLVTSGGSYGNNTQVICCPAPGRPESTAQGTSPPDNKSRGCCCRNSRPTVINPDYNTTKQRFITHIYDKIHSKSPSSLAPSPTCLHCNVTHLSLTTGVVALHIPSWRVGVRKEHHRYVKMCDQLMQVQWFVAIKIIFVESPITINI